MKRHLLYILSLLMLVSCHRVKPQAPANGQRVDSMSIVATMANMRMAEAADAECTRWVQRTGLPFVQHPSGFWYLKTLRTKGDSLRTNDQVRFLMQTYLPDSTLIEDVEKNIPVGKREVLMAVDQLLPELCEGEEVTIITPYYGAYGLTPQERIPAYSNCRIILHAIQKQ